MPFETLSFPGHIAEFDSLRQEGLPVFAGLPVADELVAKQPVVGVAFPPTSPSSLRLGLSLVGRFGGRCMVGHIVGVEWPVGAPVALFGAVPAGVLGSMVGAQKRLTLFASLGKEQRVRFLA